MLFFLGGPTGSERYSPHWTSAMDAAPWSKGEFCPTPHPFPPKKRRVEWYFQGKI